MAQHGFHSRYHTVTIRNRVNPKPGWPHDTPGYRWVCDCGDVGEWHATEAQAIKYRDHHLWDTAAGEGEPL